MLTELFRAISAQALEAALPRTLPVPGCDYLFGLTQRDGSVRLMETSPRPRNHKALSLDTLAGLAKTHATRNAQANQEASDDTTTSAVDVAVWYSRDGVVALLDDSNRRDRVCLPLTYSAPLKRLQALEQTPTTFTQRELILLLRTTFADCLGRAGEIVPLLRKLRIRKEEEGGSSVQHGKVSVGRNIMAEVTGARDLPETLDLDVPIWGNTFHYSGVVRCALEIDTATERFQLLPLPGHSERAITEAEEAIGDQLTSLLANTGIQVLHGAP